MLKDELDNINVESVLKSLNEGLFRGPSPYLNYVKNFLAKKKAATPGTPSAIPPVINPAAAAGSTPGNEEIYIKRLNAILDDAQVRLNKFLADDLDLRGVRRGMSAINFIFTPHKKKKPMERLPSVPIKNPNPTLGGTPPGPPGKPPINSIFEADLRAWKSRSKTLEEVMKAISQNVASFLQAMAKDVGYVPMKNDLLGLIREFNKFPNITPKTKKRVRVRLQTFLTAYSQLQSWLELFKRTEKNIEKGQKARSKI